MRTITTLTLLLVSCTKVSAVEEEKPLADRMFGFMEEMVSALKGVKDNATAEKSKPRFKAMRKQFERINRELRTLPPEKRRKFVEENRAKMKPLDDQLQKEIQRIEKMPEVAKTLGEVFPVFGSQNAKLALAKVKIRQLEQAAAAYFIQKGEYPESLEALTLKVGGGPYIESKASLRDPWGKPFQYDAKGPKNKGVKPDIWSLGASGKKETIIGNWSEKKSGK